MVVLKNEPRSELQVFQLIAEQNKTDGTNFIITVG